MELQYSLGMLLHLSFAFTHMDSERQKLLRCRYVEFYGHELFKRYVLLVGHYCQQHICTIMAHVAQ